MWNIGKYLNLSYHENFYRRVDGYGNNFCYSRIRYLKAFIQINIKIVFSCHYLTFAIYATDLDCYCETPAGGSENNNIICKVDNIFQPSGSCELDEWCTGPINAESATSREELCSKRKIVRSFFCKNCLFCTTRKNLIKFQ